jgi:hypothetical protein
MSQPPPDFKAFVELPLNQAKVRAPFTVPPLNERILFSVGQIAAWWSLYEQHFEDVLSRLVQMNGTDNPDWRTRLRGRKRRKKFKDEAATCFAGHPDLLAYVNAIKEDADRLAVRRNALLHGKIRYHYQYKANTQTLTWWIEATSDDGTFGFTEDGLETFAYEIGHLTGRIQSLVRPDDGDHGFSSPDIQKLLDFEARSRPSPPTPSTPPVRLQLPDGSNLFVSGGGDPPNAVY